MSAQDHLNGFQFTKATPKSMGGSQFHRLESNAGYMEWSHKTGEIHNIQINGAMQRQGHGTAMWNQAHEIASSTRGVKPPKHSPQRTDAGDAWAKKVGGRRPPLERPSTQSINEAERAHYGNPSQMSDRLRYSLQQRGVL